MLYQLSMLLNQSLLKLLLMLKLNLRNTLKLLLFKNNSNYSSTNQVSTKIKPVNGSKNLTSHGNNPSPDRRGFIPRRSSTRQHVASVPACVPIDLCPLPVVHDQWISNNERVTPSVAIPLVHNILCIVP